MIQFANPVFLWTLAGLSIPIGIHLLSRKEGKVIRLGSLRHVHETSTQQFKGFRLNEVLLLALRCSLIVLLSLVLSVTRWNSSGNSRWILVEKGLEGHRSIKPIIDSLANQGFEAHWLASNFPPLRDSAMAFIPASYPKLIEDIKSRNISEVIVFAQNRVNGFNGLRSPLPSNIKWISEPLESMEYVLSANHITHDSVLIRMGHTGASETYFITKISTRPPDSIVTLPPQSINVLMVSEEQYSYDTKILRAVLNAIAQSFSVTIKINEVTPTNMPSSNSSDWGFWLSYSKGPGAFAANMVLLRPGASPELLIRTDTNQWILSKRLNEEIALQSNMTLMLASMILPNRQEREDKAMIRDRRMVSDSIGWQSPKGKNGTIQAGIPFEPVNTYLLITFLALLLMERITAYNRNQ